MNVTKDGFKDRQFHMEDYLQTVSAEQNECAEVSVYQRITENKHINTDFWTDNLLELILREEKCTPVRRRKAGAQRAKGDKIPAGIVERIKGRRNGKKNARRRGEERQRPSVQTKTNSPLPESKRPRRRRNRMKNARR